MNRKGEWVFYIIAFGIIFLSSYLVDAYKNNQVNKIDIENKTVIIVDDSTRQEYKIKDGTLEWKKEN